VVPLIIVLIVVSLITFRISDRVLDSRVGALDRTLGFIFGLARGVLIVCLAYLLLDFVQPSERPAWIRDAKSAPYLHQGADMLRQFLPEQLKIKNAALDDAVQALSVADQAKEAMGALKVPGVPTVIKPDRGPSYGKGEKRDLDRLIDTQR